MAQTVLPTSWQPLPSAEEHANKVQAKPAAAPAAPGGKAQQSSKEVMHTPAGAQPLAQHHQQQFNEFSTKQ
jgi:hypothetical protein